MTYNEIRTINNIQLEDIKARQSIQELDNKKANKSDIVSGLNFKGTTTYSALPTSDNNIGDFYYVTDGDGTNGEGNYAWNGTAWYFSGKTTDFGDISTKANAAVNNANFEEGKLKVTKNDGASTETEVIDSSLTKSGKAADAKITGDKIGQLKEDLVDLSHVRLLNGFDKDNTEINKYYNSQGVLSASNGWTASLSYARVEPSKSYHAKSIYNYDLQVIAVWYDGEHNFIKQELNTSFISPDNAKYARICCNTNYADVLVFGSFDSISEYLEFGNETVLNDSVATDRIDEAILSSQNEADYASNITDFYSSEFMNIILRNGFDKTSVLKNKFLYIDGSIKDSSGWGVNENYILIKPSVTYKAMSYSLDVKQNVKVAWYDKYKGFIRVDENVDFIAPNNAKFARLCCTLNISDTFVFTEKENSSGEYLEYGYEKSIDESVKIPIKPIKSEVTSVNGKKGDVVLTSEDIGISSDVEKAVTDYLEKK